MFAPVGPKSAAVYWRRRLFLAALLLIIGYAVYGAVAGGGHRAAAAPRTSPRTSQTRTPAGTTRTGISTTTRSTATTPPGTPDRTPAGSPTAPTATTPTGAATTPQATPTHRVTPLATTKHTPPPPAACVASRLGVAAAVGASRYAVGTQPLMLLRVTNTGPTACLADVSDRLVELTIYTGQSRVWDSHDCAIQPGTTIEPIAAGQTANVGVTWSGTSSQPGCAAPRQPVGAGTYTLYARLAGQLGTAAQFSLY